MNAKKIVMLLAVIAIAFGIISTMNSGDSSSTVEEEAPVENVTSSEDASNEADATEGDTTEGDATEGDATEGDDTEGDTTEGDNPVE